MKKEILVALTAALPMTTVNFVTAQEIECEKNFQAVRVEGSVTTRNISDTMQVGSINLELHSFKKEGKVLFNQTGALVGEVTNPGYFDPEIGQVVVLLDHDITFADGVSIETNGDRAILQSFPPFPGVGVTEVISDFSGTKTFRQATGEIEANGTLLNYVGEDENGPIFLNYFGLSGELCIKD